MTPRDLVAGASSRATVLLVVVGAVVLGAGAGFVAPTGSAGPIEAVASTTTAHAPAPGAASAGPNERNASLSLSLTSPSPVSNANGTVGNVTVPLSGSASWNGSVGRAVVSVRAWTPANGWRLVTNRTVHPSGSSLDVAAAVGPSVLAARANESGFSDPVNGTTVERTGYVSVSVSLFADGSAVGSASRTASYSFTVTNAPSPSSANASDGSTNASTTANTNTGTASASESSSGDGPRLVFVSDRHDPTAFGASNVAPGASGGSRVTMRNAGGAAGRLVVAASNWTNAENGLIAPEVAAGDHTPNRGELRQHLRIRVAVVGDGGGVEYLAGSASSFANASDAPASSLGFERTLSPGANATLVFQWRLPAATGNVVQSDAAGLNYTYTLRSTTKS